MVCRTWAIGLIGRGRVLASSGTVAAIASLRSSHPGWDPRRIVDELARRGVEPVPSFHADRVSAGFAAAQDELDEWAEEHNHRRPHGADGTWVA